ncbi:MAG: FtsX-like permease family protein, partial [Lachnospiraceae bacterium]|nr:FtsX-like permease family protein [Lachnospiraceae bacterium]
KPDTYVLTRNVNIGYASFENDSSIVEGIGNVFPIFFFLVAALVCMTTMNRMVEEKRTEIGVMKALGYKESRIMGKFLFYSGSAAIVGAVSGFIVGSKIFPYVIWHAYGILYNMPEIKFVINPVLATVSMIVAVICSMGATYVTLRNELRSNAADLIRPKAPASGKRVFLERITFIWKRMKFTNKVSVRNVFRYQKRLWMMVLGVGGCYGLLITGLGIRDSIADVCDRQFIDIQKYDMTVSFKGEGGDRSDFEALIEDDRDFIYSLTKTVDVVSGNKVKSATLVVFDDSAKDKTGADFINFMDKNDRTIPLPEKDEAILTEKMAKLLGVDEGDEVILRDTDMNEITVKVSGVMKNYVYNWAYISPETYLEARGEKPDFNTAYVKTEEDGYALGAKVNGLDYVSSVGLTEEMSKRISSMMSSLDQVVWLVIASAAALAFIVMYNLTNINITERLREIATLKVLGFYSGETAVYVFRENMILTAFGIIAGLFMGYGLHRYVMYNINVEVVTFDTKILPVSYVYGVLLTFAFALFVDLVLFFKLEKIKMAESLKSVE